MSELTLTVDRPTLKSAEGLAQILRFAGFNAVVCSPFSNFYTVVIKSSDLTANMGSKWDEVKSAERLCNRAYCEVCGGFFSEARPNMGEQMDRHGDC